MPVAAGIAMAFAACSLFAPSGVTPPGDMRLGVSNGTTLRVSVVVNGVQIEEIAPSDGADLPASALPPLSWNVEVRSPSGRVLVRLTVNAGDVSSWNNADGSGGSRGDAARVDLSCGRIDVWSGPPLLGPMPGPGTPGDCAP